MAMTAVEIARMLELHGGNAVGQFAIAASTTAARLSATSIFIHTAIIQCSDANSDYIAFGGSAVDAGSSSQNAPRYGAGREITLRFNNLKNIYFRSNNGTPSVYVMYTYWDESVPHDSMAG